MIALNEYMEVIHQWGSTMQWDRAEKPSPWGYTMGYIMGLPDAWTPLVTLA